MKHLPIYDHSKKIISLIRSEKRLIIESPPGSGKTTGIPSMLYKAGLLENQKLLITVPRRVAALGAAFRISEILASENGVLAGFRIKGAVNCSDKTRIEAVTEGILLRLIHDESILSNLGIIMIDEFHERSVNADLIFALLLEIQNILMPELKIVIMSATLPEETTLILKKKFAFNHIKLPGKIYPVEISHQPPGVDIFRKILAVLQKELQNLQSGRVLIFFDGLAAINRMYSILESSNFNKSLAVKKFFGQMNIAEQQKILAENDNKDVEIILATNIAESSLTVPGVSVVIDTGKEKESYFDIRRGFNTLRSVPISRLSAEQRSGRAGRTCPGKAIRLWDLNKEKSMLERREPEINRVNIDRVILEAMLWTNLPEELKWLTVPAAGRINEALRNLQFWSLIDDGGTVTKKGRTVLAKGLSLRESIIIFEAEKLNYLAGGALLAAILEEKDFLSFCDNNFQSDIMLRIEAVLNKRSSFSCDKLKILRILKNAGRYGYQKLKTLNTSIIREILARAYADRIAQKRDKQDNSYLTADGQGVSLFNGDSLRDEEYLAVMEICSVKGRLRAKLAIALKEEEITEWFRDEFAKKISLEIRGNRFCKIEIIMLGKITIRESVREASVQEKIVLLKQFIQNNFAEMIRRDDKSCLLLTRIKIMENYLPEEITRIFDPHNFNNSFMEFLLLHIEKIHNLEDLNKISIYKFIIGLIPFEVMKIINKEVPEHITLASGKILKIDYSEINKPVVRGVIQVFFGTRKDFVLAFGKLPLVIELLSPAFRIVQITTSLDKFWKDSYHLVRKDLRGRYPKHKWPEFP